jgi:hypothetical protein
LKIRLLQWLCALLTVMLPGTALPGQSKAPSVPAPGPVRLAQLVEANIVAVHAYQLLLAQKQANTDPVCWPVHDWKAQDLEALVAHQTSLLKAPMDAKRWALGAPSPFDPKIDLQPLLDARFVMPANLPVNVFADYLHTQVPQFRREEIRSIANLYQTVLEVERDGDRLQDLYSFYIALELPLYIGQMGLPGTDTDLLTAGTALAGRACVSPVGLSAAEWQIAGRKVWNWGEKNLHIRDAQVVADELLTEPDVRTLLPTMKAVEPERVAVMGHSFTMDLHWASPSAFVPIVTAMFAKENPAVEFRQFQAGGLTSTRALKNFYADALAWRPNVVLLVLANRTDQDLSALRTMGEGFKSAGARVVMFDDVHDPDSGDRQMRSREADVAQEAGIEVVKVSPILAVSPDRSHFLCLDHIHMTEPYHRLMAKEWLSTILNISQTSKAN